MTMVDWGDLGYAVPGYNAYKIGSDIANSDAAKKFLFGGANAENSQYQDRDQMLKLINQGYAPGGITQQQAPQLQMGDDPFRRAQLQQMQQLQGIASGQQQGAGELAAQRQYANAMAGQQAQARMVRGGGAGLAYRNAANQSAALGSTAAGMGQQAALQDQQAAQGQLQQVGAFGRQGDYSTANANAGYQQGAQQLNSQNYQQLLQQLGGMDANQLAARNQASQDKGMFGSLLSAGGQIAGSAIAASDERLKTDVTDARADIDAMLDGLKPVGWTYKDSKWGEGRHSGIMAQDMERSKVGREVVTNTPEGKMLGVNKALGIALASTARLNERLRKLENEQRAKNAADLPRARVVKR